MRRHGPLLAQVNYLQAVTRPTVSAGVADAMVLAGESISSPLRLRLLVPIRRTIV